MNEQRKQRLHQLEVATQPRGMPLSDTDPETLALRESWVAWAELLDDAAPHMPPVCVERRPTYGRRASIGNCTAVLAALLLIVLLPWVNQRWESVPKPAVAEPGTERVAVAGESTNSIGWDAPVDALLAQSGASMQVELAPRSAIDASVAWVGERLDRVAAEFADETL